MFAKLLSAGSLEDLEKKLGTYFSEVQNGAPRINGAAASSFKINHVHSFITQEVSKTATITAAGPGRDVVTKFSLLIIASYE